MKILLDHNLDRRLKADISGHEVATAYESGWADVKNGELLSLAEQNDFDVLLTADTNISKQQNLTGRKISIVILRALDNRRSTHIEMIRDVLAALKNVAPGSVSVVTHSRYAKRH